MEKQSDTATVDNLEISYVDMERENLRVSVKLLENDIAKNYLAWELSFVNFRNISKEEEITQRVDLIKRYSALSQRSLGLSVDSSNLVGEDILLGLTRCRAILRHVYEITQGFPGQGIPIEIGQLLEHKV